MGRIFYIIGKSATGKDSILEAILKDEELKLHEIIQYTTRPIRAGEQEGREYHFITMEQAEAFEAAGKVIESRCYQTVHGPWKYMMVDDGTAAADVNYAAVGTIESYVKVRDYFGSDRVVPIYIHVETGERLQRALNRERKHAGPKYAEMCRRFLADEAEFCDDNMKAAGLMNEDGTLTNGFENVNFDECVQAVKEFILGV